MLDNNKSEKGWARVRREAYQSGRELGYNLGYSQGLESGFEKGYAEGSALGYNNGFLSALKLGENTGHEGGAADEGCVLKRDIVCQLIRKLVDGGQVQIALSGSAAKEAEILFKLINIDVQKVTDNTTGSW